MFKFKNDEIIDLIMKDSKILGITNEKEIYNFIQERWNTEDELLNMRTAAFLTVNAILFAASQFQNKLNKLNLLLAIAGIIIAIFWLIVSFRTSKYLVFFASLSNLIVPNDLRQIYNYKSIKNPIKFLKFSPTDTLSLYLPLLILCMWISFTTYISYFIIGNSNYKFYFYLCLILINFLIFLLYNIIYYCNKNNLLNKITISSHIPYKINGKEIKIILNKLIKNKKSTEKFVKKIYKIKNKEIDDEKEYELKLVNNNTKNKLCEALHSIDYFNNKQKINSKSNKLKI